MAIEPRVPTCRGVVTTSPDVAVPEVKWIAPAAPHDRRAHAEWCGTVGPVVVTPQPAAVSPLTAGDVLAVLSWNTHVGGGDVATFVRRLRAGDWSDGRRVSHFVLLLQETFRQGRHVPMPVGASPPVPTAIMPSPISGQRLDVVALAAGLGLSLFYAPSMRNGLVTGPGSAEDRGNAILATLPLRDFRVVELPFERQRRVAVAATLTWPAASDTSLHVSSVHLDPRASSRRLFLFAPPARTRQAKGLVEALPRGEPALVGGDFNTWLSGSEGALSELRRAFPDTPRGKGATLGAMRVDYLFFRLPKGWRGDSQVIHESFGSDHRAVLGWLYAAPERSR